MTHRLLPSIALTLFGLSAVPALAQPIGAPLPAPPRTMERYPQQELERIVSPIALYPDSLLGNILTAATFAPDIPEAAQWADEHHYVPRLQLPSLIAADRLPFEPSVQALLPFPEILNMMATSMPWTEELGAAFLSQPEDVMDAVQSRRELSYRYGYLRSNREIIVRNGPYIEIIPADPWYFPIPHYDPFVVYAPPRPGFVISGGIRFGYGVRLGAVYAPWGWSSTKFLWNQKMLILNNDPWRRTWVNKGVYVHPYAGVTRYAKDKAIVNEKHNIQVRSAKEKEAANKGSRAKEEHKGNPKKK